MRFLSKQVTSTYVILYTFIIHAVGYRFCPVVYRKSAVLVGFVFDLFYGALANYRPKTASIDDVVTNPSNA